MQTTVLLSIKPQYADKILNGDKRFEFRRLLYKSPNVKKIVIYATSPVMKVVGEFGVAQVHSMNLEELWEQTMEYSGIEKHFYDSYFAGKNVGHAIEIKDARRYKNPKLLKDYNISHAPQSFVYL
jgi:predicted transcriptional regulator